MTTPPLPVHESVASGRRLTQIQTVAMAVMGVNGLISLFQGNRTAFLVLLGGVLLLAAAMGLGRKGHQAAATSLTLGTLTLLASGLMWTFQGLHDGAMLTFPGILVFAAILGSGRLFGILLGFMLAVMGLILVAGLQGWHVVQLVPVSIGMFIGLAAILLGSGLAIWMLARDLRQTLGRLQEENERAVQSQAHIEFLANYDPLTGLPNRTLGRDRLHLAVAQAQRNHTLAALVHLDLDHFKTVNDSLGHRAGDQLLLEAMARIQTALRPADTLCRQGGDEFLVILGDLADGDEAAALAERLLATLAEPFRLQGLDLTMTASVGLAMYPDDGQDFETLMQKADTAMYQAKALGRNGFQFFDPAMNAHVLTYLQTASSLHTALERREFLLHYQPQIDLRTNRIIGAEALIRWQHPERGLILPGSFIPVAERSGQIGEIGKWALEEACREARCWRDQGLDLVLSVNLSPVQFKREDLLSTLQTALADAELPSSCIKLELTESMLIEDSPELSRKLTALKDMGMGFSIDDFGTGYSNLSYLQRFAVESLKVDQSFVKRLNQSLQDEALVQAVIQMARSLNLITVAEGIEDRATLEHLKTMGCDQGQGFHWAEALSAEAFLAYYRVWPGA